MQGYSIGLQEGGSNSTRYHSNCRGGADERKKETRIYRKFSYRLNRLNWTTLNNYVGKLVNELNSSIKALNVVIENLKRQT